MEPITWNDFAKIEIKIGTVTEASVPEGSNHLIKLTVDFGEPEPRTIFSGILQWYKPEDLVGQQFPFITNIAPRKMGDFGESHGMIMAASPKNTDGTETAELFFLKKSVPNGTIVR